jgi:2-succinyl-6-hydroxy-2,4-cyclohexadiene-1-carboxylate synthase
MDHAANELLATWDRLGLEKTHLAGYSLGGRLALWVAEAHPERLLSLLTIGAHAGIEGSGRETRRSEDERLAGRIEKEGMEWFAADWASRPIFDSLARRRPDLVDSLRGMRLANDPAGLAAALRGMGAGATEPFWSRLERLQEIPATFVAGAEDAPYVQAAHRLAEAVSGGRVEIVAEAGHAAHLERPEAVAAVLGRHLSSR